MLFTQLSKHFIYVYVFFLTPIDNGDCYYFESNQPGVAYKIVAYKKKH